ncbi:4'-demethylrebeccamycin synthase [Cytospora mali]|uniref:4'-demethylrebeccamycin synthase n=1 Tax=Cytospora mali TaxID=578113 RepID=A0A194USK3_CYTMA|nr:4'-demethylrebeccamycin synthase [Valsa mali var. pyri (nom. inval.)]
MAVNRPLILFATLPFEGHMTPALQISGHLVSKGFHVTLVTAEVWRPAVEACEARFSPALGLLGSPLEILGLYPEVWSGNNGPQRTVRQLEFANIDIMPSALESVRFGLMNIKGENPDSEVIVLCDTSYPAGFALKLGAQVPGFDKPIKTVGISVSLPFWTDPKTPPYLSGLPYDDSEAGQARNKLVASTMWPQPLRSKAQETLKSCGIAARFDSVLDDYKDDSVEHIIWDSWWVCHNTTLQMCIPSLEYPSNWPPHCKFGGMLPIKALTKDLAYPEWFEEVVTNSSQQAAVDADGKRKKIVVVAQGTVIQDHNILVVPTIKALCNRDDLLVVAILCRRGATLSIDGGLPANARVIDYFPYDALLAHADVFITNSGYGGFAHAVSNGVPMVQTGDTEDKMDVGRRIVWSGLGEYVNPITVENIGDSVGRVLERDKFMKRAQELRKEADEFKTFEVVEREIMALMK